MKQNIHPKLLEPRSRTLKRKAEELATPCDPHGCVLMYGSDGNVQIWPNHSDAADKKISNSSPKVKKQKVLDSIGEGVEDLESWADELDKLVRELLMGLSEQILDENKESSQPIDTAGKGPDHLEEELEKLPWESLMGSPGFLESMEQKLDETINSIEGSKSSSNCNSPLRLNADFWNDPMFEGFDEGKAISTDAIWPWPGFDSGTSTSNSLVCQNTHYPAFPSVVGTSSSSSTSGNDQWWELGTNLENCTIFSRVGGEFWINNEMMMTGLEEHQSCASAAGTSGYSNSSTPPPCKSGKGLTDPLGFEAAANDISSLLYDRDQQSMVAPQPSPKVLLTNSLGAPKHLEFDKNRELIIID